MIHINIFHEGLILANRSLNQQPKKDQKLYYNQNSKNLFMEIQNPAEALVLEVPANYQAQTPLIASYVFLLDENNVESQTIVELYDDQIIYWSIQNKQGSHKKNIKFSFDVRFELLRRPNPKVIQKTKLNPPYGLKFDTGNSHICFYSTDLAELIDWRDFIVTKLNQRGFHQLFKPIKKIGKGNFASVYLAERLEDNRKFAIKAFSKEATYSEEKGKQSLINQIELMRKLNNPNIMKLYEVYESQNSIYISVELLEGGQLYDKIKIKHKFTLIQIKTVLIGLLRGLEHMHQKRIMHRDLKPQNILIRKEGTYDCVIADFGLATWADQKEYLFVRCGTPGYVAPEIVNIKDLTAKCDPICDVFSLGLIFHIMLVGKSAFPGKTYNEVLTQNRACDFKIQGEEFYKFGPEAVDLLKKMLEKNPKLRLSATQCLKHPFFITGEIPQEQQIQKQAEIKSINQSTRSSLMSPLLTSSNPYRKKDAILQEDSCLKFKMQQNILTGKTNVVESGQSIQNSPSYKKATNAKYSAMQKLNENEIKQLSKFAKKTSTVQNTQEQSSTTKNQKKGFLTPYNR